MAAGETGLIYLNVRFPVAEVNDIVCACVTVLDRGLAVTGVPEMTWKFCHVIQKSVQVGLYIFAITKTFISVSV